MSCSVAQRPSTSLLQDAERPLRRQTVSFEDSKRVKIHVKLSSARHHSVPEIVFRPAIGPDQKPRRSAAPNVTVEVSQKHISRTPSVPKYLKSAQHRVVILKGREAKKNLFII
ncbi:hypothetical protein QR680_013224 [Steinernema hermaphroditum]|nr:hypothetical protein QR680_013224 [Steinernema hermaphroditum]